MEKSVVDWMGDWCNLIKKQERQKEEKMVELEALPGVYFSGLRLVGVSGVGPADLTMIFKYDHIIEE